MPTTDSTPAPSPSALFRDPEQKPAAARAVVMFCRLLRGPASWEELRRLTNSSRHVAYRAVSNLEKAGISLHRGKLTVSLDEAEVHRLAMSPALLQHIATLPAELVDLAAAEPAEVLDTSGPATGQG